MFYLNSLPIPPATNSLQHQATKLHSLTGNISSHQERPRRQHRTPHLHLSARGCRCRGPGEGQSPLDAAASRPKRCCDGEENQGHREGNLVLENVLLLAIRRGEWGSNCCGKEPACFLVPVLIPHSPVTYTSCHSGFKNCCNGKAIIRRIT